MAFHTYSQSFLAKWFPGILGGVLFCFCFNAAEAEELRIGTFAVDASPAIGSPLAYDPTREITEPLSLRGIVLVPENQKPIVMCVVDWLGVANTAQDEFRQAIAAATRTTTDRVVIHAIHQHDAPRCDLSAAAILDEYGGSGAHYDARFIHQCIRNAAQAAATAIEDLSAVESIRCSKAQVFEVASNRRMLGPNGKVHVTRYTACKDPKIRELPEGVIDPWLRTLTFTGGQGDLAVLTFYATHPQSYYRTGAANPDFPGMARNARQAKTGVFHLHFNGAGGNIGAGKYNDGSTQNRQVLADRVEDAMRRSYQALEHQPLQSIKWQSLPIQIPPGPHLKEPELVDMLKQDSTPETLRLNAAKKLAYLHRVEEGKEIFVNCLQLGENRLLFLPGELFVEYQLAAQAMRPEENIMVAAYGEYGTGYIGTRVAYPQGGYEVSERASNVSPEAEAILLNAMRTVLEVPDSRVHASDFTETFGELPR